MDLLETWGVLVQPEVVGVNVEFVSPSLLVPKTEKGEYRVVTDFSALNVFLKKIPNTSPTIAQARARIAKAKYVIHMDLSSYFYQNGMQQSDLKYLGTIHPYKGLRVYTCDPQGLKGASERCYEKLARIFGDMVQSGKLAQMADGLHPLGESIPDLLANYTEVLRRARQCGLTFKPNKVIICPRSINLFGWLLKDNVWYPTSHTVSALCNSPIPTTVKKMRSFLGSFKQLSASLPNYARVLHKLEQIVGGKASAEKIIWTEELNKAFEDAKALAKHPIGVAEPRPQDRIITYSDYSAEHKAVGGRMVIERQNSDGTITELSGGYYSAMVDKNKSQWLPCEGEALGIRLVLNHFQHFIRESDHVATHFTDSQPCVLAWKRMQRGAFSSSSRINAFLVGLSVLPIELRHKAGKDLHTSDFASRNPAVCSNNKCQICNFVQDWQSIGDNALNIRALSVEDIKNGKNIMPMTQTKVWSNIQEGDPVHTKLKDLIMTRQLPEQKKTKGDHTKIKLLHNLYVQGKLIRKNNLFLVKTPSGHFNGFAISVPPALYPGIAYAMHIRLDHPSKSQLSSLLQRYFYSPGWKAIADSISDSCHQCKSLKKLPKVLLDSTHTEVHSIGSKFAVDVIEREMQKILVVRDCFSQFTRAAIIPNQTADTLRKVLLQLITDLVPDTGTEVRVDGAPAFQSLATESVTPGTTLNKLKILVVLGRLMNKNKNPIAENTVQEIQKEILRFKQNQGPISDIDLCMILRNVNSRTRCSNLTPKEVMLRRDNLTHKPINVTDESISKDKALQIKKSAKASKRHKEKFQEISPLQSFSVGDVVMIRNSKTKNKPRDSFIVESLQSENQPFIIIRKLGNSLRPRLYKMLPDELIIVAGPVHDDASNNDPSRQRTPPVKQRPKVRKLKAFVKDKAANLFRHGWDESDQILDYAYAFPLELTDPHSHEPSQEIALSTGPHSEVSSSDNSSEEDLMWDTTPHQYMLTRPHEPEAWSSTPFAPEPATIPPPFPRERVTAFSQPPVTRSNAFRLPTHNQAFNVTRSSRPSKLPVPVSPAAVETTQVNLLTHVLPVPQLRRSNRLARPRLQAEREDSEGEEEEKHGHASTA